MFRSSRTAALLTKSMYRKNERRYRTKLECSICFPVRTFSDANCLRRHEREIHQMHGGSRKLFCQHKNCNNHNKNPFKRPEYLIAHTRAVHGGQPSDSHDAVIQDGLKTTTTASELKSNEETPWHRYRRSGPEEGCQKPPGEHIKTQIEAVQAESSSIRTIFDSLGVEMQSLKAQLSQIQAKANNLSIGS